jgi:AraC-like DNA-binding protein
MMQRRDAHFHRPLKIDQLASNVGMSVSSLHHHFKAVTAMTPLSRAGDRP